MNRTGMRGIHTIMKSMGVVGQLIVILFLVGVYFHTTSTLDMHQTSESNQDPFYAQKSYPEPVAAAAEMQAAVVAAQEVFAAEPVEKVQVVEETIYKRLKRHLLYPASDAYHPPTSDFDPPVRTGKKKKVVEPIDKSQDNPINDPHGTGFLRMKEISNKEIFVGDIGDSCKNIMKTGRWLTWEQNGFERAISVDGHEIDVQDPKDERYPDMFPPWYIWRRQNYTGQWASDAGCEIHRYTKPELAQCLGDGEQSIYVVGSERGRQLQKAMVVYLEGQQWGFKDKEHFHHANGSVPGVAETVFYWSQQFREVMKSGLGSGLISNVKTALSEATTANNKGNLIIIEEHLLHTLEELEEKVHDIDDPVAYVAKLVKSFKAGALPSIIMALKKRPTMHIFVLAAQYPNLDKKVQPLYIKLVDQYNMQMEEAVRKIDMLYENVLWVPATQKMGQSPGETPLMPNGKLLAWPCKKYGTCGSKNVAAHEAMLDVIFNVYCRGLNRNLGPNICCQ